MGVAIALENGVEAVEPAVASGEHFAGGTDVGSVKEDDSVEACDCRVHGSYACILHQKFPRAWELSMCEFSGNRYRNGEDEEKPM